MKQAQLSNVYPLDNSGIIHLAALRPGHSNVYRIAFTLNETVRPALLQQAVCAVTPRFPTIVAGIREGAAEYFVVPAETAPRIEPDPGLLLSMSPEDIRRCAMRVLYDENSIYMECFHSITDGYGGFEFMKALTAEYLHLVHGGDFHGENEILSPKDHPCHEELADSFLDHAQDRQKAPIRRLRAFLPDEGSEKIPLRTVNSIFDLEQVLSAARRHHTSLTTLLTTVMAQATMEVQLETCSQEEKLLPVQIMVPADLRRKFPSRTLRNFSLYALVGITPEQRRLSFEQQLENIEGQLRQQFTQEHLAAMISTNTSLARNPLLRAAPLALKRLFLGAGFRLIGEVNSSLTLSNMGQTYLPEAMRPYVSHIRTFLTPRIRSPHNYGMVSYNGRLYINFTRYCQSARLEQAFFLGMQRLGCTAELEANGEKIRFSSLT